MAKNRPLTDEEILQGALPKDEEIKREYSRLMTLFKGANPAAVALERKTIARTAFLAITIDRLEKDIAENGYREEYTNGANQRGYKKSVAADMLPNYTKLYFSAVKELREALKPETAGEPDELLAFLAAQEGSGEPVPAWAEEQLQNLDEFERFDYDSSRSRAAQ